MACIYFTIADHRILLFFNSDSMISPNYKGKEAIRT